MVLQCLSTDTLHFSSTATLQFSSTATLQHNLPTDVRNPDSSLKDLVQLRLVKELWVPGLDGLELDCHLLAVGDVDAEVDVAEAAAADLSDLK